jgi:hypothetical protein
LRVVVTPAVEAAAVLISPSIEASMPEEAAVQKQGNAHHAESVVGFFLGEQLTFCTGAKNQKPKGKGGRNLSKEGWKKQ